MNNVDKYIQNMDTFTEAYIECALWSTLSDCDNEEYLDDTHTIYDISEACLHQMVADCTQFQAENIEYIENKLSQAGHDFWLTRNGHGAGFWDGDWPEHGEYLTEKSKEFKEVDLYVGDDGLIYC